MFGFGLFLSCFSADIFLALILGSVPFTQSISCKRVDVLGCCAFLCLPDGDFDVCRGDVWYCAKGAWSNSWLSSFCGKIIGF